MTGSDAAGDLLHCLRYFDGIDIFRYRFKNIPDHLITIFIIEQFIQAFCPGKIRPERVSLIIKNRMLPVVSVLIRIKNKRTSSAVSSVHPADHFI